jgi:hypothetical protein
MFKPFAAAFVPHWFVWGLCLLILGVVNALMILGHQSHNVVETNVPCKVVDMTNDHSMILKMDCHGIVDTIGGSSEVLAIVKSKINTARCIYENGNISDCKPMGLD